MADWHGGSEIDEDFEEEDIWSSAMKEREDSNLKMRKSKDYTASGSGSASASAWHIHATAPRKIPTPTPAEAKSKTTHVESKAVEQSSAPVKIPDWSKIYGKNTKMEYDDYHVNIDGENENDEGDGMVPPHEWIAKKLARSQISSFSVCEGIGRKLKGRDLSKVRNAVLTKTGFLE